MLLNQELTDDLRQILNVFGYTVDKKYTNIEKQDFVWEIVINIYKNMFNEVKETIRNNLALCYQMEEKKQMKVINQFLYNLNHILEQDIYRFDNESVAGLTKFHNLIINTYKDINDFCKQLRNIIENIYFYRKDYDVLISKQYNYLKNISLPLKGYQGMRIALITLLKKFSQLNTIVSNSNHRRKLLDDIYAFKERYIALYINEHNKYHFKLNKFYDNINSLPEYQAVEKLSKIKTTNLEYNMKTIKKYFNNFFPDKCYEDNLEKLLTDNVRCSCGFNLGHNFNIPSLNKIKPLLKKGVSKYLHQIQQPKYRHLFDNYINYNHNSNLNKIINLNKNELNKNLDLINDKLIDEINEALSSFYSVNISLNEIEDNIHGIYHTSQLEILTEKINKVLKKVIKNKIKEIENIDYDDVIINLIK